jgi:hypothetical protein
MPPLVEAPESTLSNNKVASQKTSVSEKVVGEKPATVKDSQGKISRYSIFMEQINKEEKSLSYKVGQIELPKESKEPDFSKLSSLLGIQKVIPKVGKLSPTKYIVHPYTYRVFSDDSEFFAVPNSEWCKTALLALAELLNYIEGNERSHLLTVGPVIKQEPTIYEKTFFFSHNA